MSTQLTALRQLMKQKQIDFYYVPTADFHESEYVGAYFKARHYITGFTGSAGYALISQDKAYLWTDGRYFLQATGQLSGSGFQLMRMGIDQSLHCFLEETLNKSTLAFDFRCVNTANAIQFKQLVEATQSRLLDCDLIDPIWADRPSLPSEKAFLLSEKYSGESCQSKLARLRQKIKTTGCHYHVLNTLDDINYLFNIRGHDIACTPYVLAYAIISQEEAILYIDRQKLDKPIIDYLQAADVTLKDYSAIYDDVKNLTASVLIDETKLNYRLSQSLHSLHAENPSQMMKALKNPTEIENIKQIHVYDGLAEFEFIYWLKKNIGRQPMTEITCSDYLEACRRKQPGFIDLSFDTISGYDKHGAVIHYKATEESALELKPESLYLVDSGGQYYQGTTDITRTLALGPISEAMRLHYTAVLKGFIQLAMAKFLKGCRGHNLDVLARQPIWRLGLDYRTGTGHGVAFVGGVHEAPNGFRWKIVPERNDSCILEPGMITTDEPGIYIDNQYGIRIENELLCVPAESNEYGDFLMFETVTYVPIDLTPADLKSLTDEEIAWLNDYHQVVYDKLAPHIDDSDMLAYLKECTKAVNNR